MRPPTPPPDFDLAAWQSSLDTIEAWAPQTLAITAEQSRLLDGLRAAGIAFAEDEVAPTGFYVTEPPIAQHVTGRDGRTLADVWDEAGMAAYKGTTISGFPNLFQIVGPNTALGHSSMIFIIESQVRYVVEAAKAMRREGLAVVEPTQAAQDAWTADIRRKMKPTVWQTGGCASWYLDKFGNNTTLWPGQTFTFRQHLRHREPTLAPVLDRLEEEHEVIADVLDRLDRAVLQHVDRDLEALHRGDARGVFAAAHDRWAGRHRVCDSSARTKGRRVPAPKRPTRRSKSRPMATLALFTTGCCRRMWAAHGNGPATTALRVGGAAGFAGDVPRSRLAGRAAWAVARRLYRIFTCAGVGSGSGHVCSSGGQRSPTSI